MDISLYGFCSYHVMSIMNSTSKFCEHNKLCDEWRRHNLNWLFLLFANCRCHIGRHHRHGPPNVGHFVSMHCCILHAVRWIILCGLHRCHSIVLHFHRPVDVHSIRMGQWPREKFVRYGCGLDWFGGAQRTVVLYRLWVAAGFRRNSMAGLFPACSFK